MDIINRCGILALMVCSVIARPVHAEPAASGFIEVQTRTTFSPPKNKVTLDAGIRRLLSGQFGVGAFALLTNGWGELYAGPIYQPDKDMKFGLYAGGEQGAEGRLIPRYAFSFSAQADDLMIFSFCAEANADALAGPNADGFWYNAYAMVIIAKPFALGVHGRRFEGVGPRASWDAGPLQTWVSWTPVYPEGSEWRPGHLLAGIVLSL